MTNSFHFTTVFIIVPVLAKMARAGALVVAKKQEKLTSQTQENTTSNVVLHGVVPYATEHCCTVLKSCCHSNFPYLSFP